VDTNVVTFLNEQLSKKPNVRIPFKRHETHQRCKLRKGAGDWFEDCTEVDVVVNDVRPGPATVTSSFIVQVNDFRFDETRTVSLPAKARVQSETFKNCSDGINLTKSFTMSVTVTKGWSVTKTRGLSTTVGASVTIAGDIKFLKGSGTVSFSQTVTSSTAQNESASYTETRSSTETLVIKPQSAGVYSLLAFEETLEIPYSATVVVDGPLATNLSGFAKASDLLSVAERSVPFEGVLRITDASRGETSIKYLDWKVVCAADEAGEIVHVVREFDVPEAALSAQFRSSFTAPADQKRENGTAVGTLVSAFDTIGPPPDGRAFEVMYSLEEMRMDAGNCGFNDLGVPNAGVYRVDYGMWHEYAGGKEVAQYSGTQEQFLRCYVP
jgi:hypothetical protein